jgi:hypothetical protein
MPCKGNYRQKIEASRKRLAEDKAYRASPAWRHWESLVKRVHKDDEGFSGLSPSEQKYFAARVLVGEVYNGGFHQYFCNSSADHYSRVLEILVEVGAPRSLHLLREAKEAVFGKRPLPKRLIERRAMLSSISEAHGPVSEKLDQLDKLFWEDPDGLDERIEKFAEANALRKDF